MESVFGIEWVMLDTLMQKVASFIAAEKHIALFWMTARRCFTEPCEAILNWHPQVSRSALVGIKKDEKTIPVMVIEPTDPTLYRSPRAVQNF